MSKRKRVEKRSRQRNWALRQQQLGLCPGCGDERLDINSATGKPYRTGPICRAKVNEYQKLLMRRRRADGIAAD